MKNEYLNEITMILKQAYPNLSTKHKLEFKNVFGAVGGYLNGCIFASCGNFGIALKLPKEVLGGLFREKDVKHLKYFPNGHVKKDYAVLPKRMLEDKRLLKKLLDESIQFVI